jgi:hypothetical protein
MGQNFFQGGIGGLLVPVCMLVRDFPAIPAEQNGINNIGQEALGFAKTQADYTKKKNSIVARGPN